MDDNLYAAAISDSGEPTVVELVAMMLNVFQVRRGTDTPLLFA